MTYCEIQEEEHRHILNLISWISDEVLSAGGDGDFLWYSRFYDIKDIIKVVDQYNESMKFKWDIIFNEEGQRISCSRGQEGFIITNNEEDYKNAPVWQQGILKL